ncbi:MAG: hypothetical protein IT184_12915 [Acidobacteria bacterium]|nr:hypothetical protein [Acidobacteriota bacterium]
MDDGLKTTDVIEAWLVRHIAAALSIEPASLDRTQPLFSLGLDSLALFTITGDLAEWLNRELPAMLLWDAPTITDAARAIAQETCGRDDVAPAAIATGEQREAPLTYQQARLWRHAEHGPIGDRNVIVRRWIVTGDLDVAALGRALRDLIARHEILRTTFLDRPGEPAQVVHAPGRPDLVTYDVRPAADPAADADRLMREEQQRPMRLDNGPLLRAVVIRVGERDWRIVLALHHLVIDAYAFRVFYEELAECYAAALDGRAAALPPPAVQVGDVARLQREQLRPGGPRVRALLDWWTALLEPPLPRMVLPFERRPDLVEPDPPIDAFRWILADDSLLRALAQREQTTLFSIHLAALAALVADATGEPDAIVGTYVSERGSSALSRAIGCYVNLLPLRVRVDRSAAFLDHLRATHGVVRLASAHQDMPFDDLSEALQARGRPAPAISVIYEHSRSLPRALELKDTAIELVRGRATADDGWGLSISTQDLQPRVIAVMSFDGKKYRPAAIAAFMARYLALIEAAVARPDAVLGDLLRLTEADASLPGSA